MRFFLNGVVSNIQVGDAVEKLEFAFILSGTDANEAAAIAAGRGLTYNSPSDDDKIAAFFDTGSVVAVSLGTGTYTPSVRVTESRLGSGTYVGAWTQGNTFTTTTASAPTISNQWASTDVCAVVNAFSNTGSPVAYALYRATDSNGVAGTFSCVAFTSSYNQYTIKDPTAVDGVYYHYKVAGIGTNGEFSPFSSVRRLCRPNYFADDFAGSNGDSFNRANMWDTAYSGALNASSYFNIQSNKATAYIKAATEGVYGLFGVSAFTTYRFSIGQVVEWSVSRCDTAGTSRTLGRVFIIPTNQTNENNSLYIERTYIDNADTLVLVTTDGSGVATPTSVATNSTSDIIVKAVFTDTSHVDVYINGTKVINNFTMTCTWTTSSALWYNIRCYTTDASTWHTITFDYFKVSPI